jgi:hypothetical protein
VGRAKLHRKRRGVDSKLKQLKPVSEPNAFEVTVTAPDLFEYALKGDPLAPQFSKRPPVLRTLFKAHRIHPLDNAESKIKRLTHDITPDSSIMLGRAGISLELEPSILKDIQTCTSWARFHRMMSILSSTRQGCESLAENGEAVVLGIIECRKRQSKADESPPLAEQVLMFLNNLTLNMRSRGVQVGPHLCNAGLYYASIAGAIPAVKMYPKISQDASYPTNSQTEKAVAHLARYVLRNTLPNSRYLKGPRNSHQDAIVLFWLGGNKDDGPSSGKERQPSFADLLSHELEHIGATSVRLDLHSRYLLILGEIGFSQTLLYEWKRLGDPKIYPSLPADSDDQPSKYVSTIAFLLAKDRSRPLSILEAITGGGENAALGRSPRLTLVAIRKSLSLHYSLRGLSPSEGFRKQMKISIPKGPENALNAIDRLLVNEFSGSTSHQPESVEEFDHAHVF